mmetsp:Transcript_17298/g.26198  ORF Transcript_17298/g.26198 Transcript_17298/m.26198 type:complete len:906 (-) Transcript_17298:1-2718(-)
MPLNPKSSGQNNPKRKNRSRKHRRQKHNERPVSSELQHSYGRRKIIPESEDYVETEGGSKSARNRVEFVYPRDKKTGKSQIFSFKTRLMPESAPICESSTQTDGNSNSAIESETLDDILSARGSGSTSGPLILLHPEVCESKNTQNLSERRLSGVSVEDAVRDKSGCRPRANSTDGELKLPRRGLCDEGMVLQSHIWSSPYHQVTPKGFINLGNTCFLNATLQCLAYLPPLCQSVSLLDSCSGKISNGQRITQNLRQLFRQVHNYQNQNSNRSEEGAIAPRNMVKSLPMLGSIGSRNGYKFRPGRQEDAHEFLVHLLDAMQDGELRSAGINQHVRGWRDNLPIPRLDETTLVHRIFGGYLRSQVKCTKCGYCSNTYDPFLDLALEVSKKSSTSISSAFKEFARKETLDKNNQWKCSGCRKSVCATKQLTVFRPPLALCIQLKRFTYSNSFGLGNFSGYSKGMKFGGFGSGSKISKSIEFPACLRLPLSDGRKCEYALTGIVVHLGSSATTGHYTSFVKKPGHSNVAKWYHMDDSYVEAVSEKTVLRQKDVYLLFYCRVEVKLELPSPPSRPSMTTEQAKKFNIARCKARSESLESSTKALTAERSPLNGCTLETSTNILVKAKQTSPDSQESTVDGSKSSFLNTSTNILVEAKRTSLDLYESTDDISNEDGSKSKFLDNEGETTTKSDLVKRTRDNSESSEVPSISNSTVSLSTMEVIDVSKPGRKTKEDGTVITKDLKPRTKVVVPRGDSNGKLEIMIGPRYKSRKAWAPKATYVRSSNEKFGLLGTQSVSTWEEEDVASVTPNRKELVVDMAKKDNVRKKKMHLDRWDSLLDQGKRKKVKNVNAELMQDMNKEPKANPFHRIQFGIQKMNKGRAKGFSRQSGKTRIISKKKKSKLSFKNGKKR